MVVEQYVDKEMSNVGLEVTKVVDKVVQIVTRNSGFDIYDHVGDNIGCWAIGEVDIYLNGIFNEDIHQYTIYIFPLCFWMCR